MQTSLKLLLIEDDPLDAELIIATLEADGFECTWNRIQSRKALLAALEQEQYDIVLVDYNLPGFDGLDAIRLLVGMNLLIPIILVTGNLKVELAIDSIKAGATDFVHKDRLTRLGASVQRALNEFELRRADAKRQANLKIFSVLNEAANRGASLKELASTLAKYLPMVLVSKDVTVYLRSPKEDSLVVYGLISEFEGWQHIEKMLDISLPTLQVPLSGNNT